MSTRIVVAFAVAGALTSLTLLSSRSEQAATYADRPVVAWIKELQSGTEQQRVEASYALTQLGKAAAPAVTVLTEALNDSNPHVQRNAAQALAKIGPPARGAAAQLVQALRSKDDVDLRRYAASAVGAIGQPSKEAALALTAALTDPDHLVRRNAADALGKIGVGAVPAIPALVERLGDENLYVRRSSREALAAISPAAIPPLVDALSDERSEVRFRAADALGAIGDAAVPALVKALGSDHVATREAAARALVYMQSRDPAASPIAAIPALATALSRGDGDQEVRPAIWSARALGRLGPDAAPAVESLVTLLASDDRDTHYEAVLALARIGSQPRLLEELRSGPVRGRAGAAEALGYMRPITPEVIDALTAALEDEDELVRFRTAAGMGALWPQALDRLVRLLEHDSQLVRRGAAYALGNPLSNFAGVESDRSGWDRAWRTAVAALAKALVDPDVGVRRRAALGLRRMSRGRPAYTEMAASPLADVFDDVNEDPTVRYHAGKALARLRPDVAEMFESETDRIARTFRVMPYPGFDWDLQMLRRTNEVEGPNVKGSSPEAISAAQRVFNDMPWTGLTRRRVLELLGDPRTISDYGRPADLETPNAPLEYMFDNGWAVSRYTVQFENGIVAVVE